MAKNKITEEKKAAQTDLALELPPEDNVAPKSVVSEDQKNPLSEGDNAPEQAEKDELYSLEFLASEFRIPSWQVAALHRMMRWEKGKKVSKKDYSAAVETLKKRPLGA